MKTADQLQVLLVMGNADDSARIRSDLALFGVRAVKQLPGLAEVLCCRASGHFDFDLVIADLRLPDGDGLEVLHAITGAGSLRKFVLLTNQRDLQSALTHLPGRIGGSRITTLAKPISAVRIGQLLQRTLAWQPEAAKPTELSLQQIANGIAAEQFVAYLEPQIDVQSGSVVGFEALARWHHPDLGVITPGRFIPQIERSPQMQALTLAMVDSACDLLISLQALGYSHGISINVGAECLSDHHFPARLAKQVQQSGVRARDITLEITESAQLDNPAVEISTLARLRLYGFQLAIDDFGMGHSSLARMHHGAFNELKIDREFTSQMNSDRTSRAAVESALSLAKSLGWYCVAEGVESIEIRDALAASGCQIMQGYLFAQPIPPAEVEAWWQQWEQQRLSSLHTTLVQRRSQQADHEDDHAGPPAMVDDRMLAILAGRSTPVWIFDLDRLAIVWANPAAVKFWRADSLQALQARDLASDMSASVRERLRAYRERLRDGQPLTEQWTLYPQGEPQLIDCVISGVYTRGGRASMLVEGTELGPSQAEASYDADSAMALGLPLMTLSTNGEILWRNPAASRVFDLRYKHFRELFHTPSTADIELQQAASHAEIRHSTMLHTRSGLQWARIYLRRYRDRASGRVLISSAYALANEDQAIE